MYCQAQLEGGNVLSSTAGGGQYIAASLRGMASLSGSWQGSRGPMAASNLHVSLITNHSSNRVQTTVQPSSLIQAAEAAQCDCDQPLTASSSLSLHP